MRQLFSDAQHLFRMAGLFVIGTSSILVLRAFLVPPDFGVYGHYRASAITENAAQQRVYAGREVCQACHEAIVETRAGGGHEGIGCETCHGALGDHAAEPSTVPIALPQAGELCGNCHSALDARPSTFPQVDLEDHSDGAECSECHDPHNPGFE